MRITIICTNDGGTRMIGWARNRSTTGIDHPTIPLAVTNCRTIDWALNLQFLAHGITARDSSTRPWQAVESNCPSYGRYTASPRMTKQALTRRSSHSWANQIAICIRFAA